MSHEIIYTSAPQGLKPGSKGFCTVVATAGIPKNLLERLESLSGYHHAFMTQEVGGVQNPINFAHYRLTLGGRRYDVMSRVCDAGLDYTQRTNKLAHHVALEAAEVAAAVGGPACVLAAPGFCVERWDGQVQTLPNGRRPPVQDCPVGICRAWEQATGDAGWAGVLAESALQADHTMSILFRPGLDTLPLLVEALSLLPFEKRWDVTFSTYYSKTGGMDCHWRFVLDDSTDAVALRRDPRARCLDLCKPLGPASGGELVTMARTGVGAQRAETKRAGPAQRVAPDRSRPALPAGQPPELPPPEAPPEYRMAPPDLPAASGPANGWKPSPSSLTKRWGRGQGLPTGLKAVLAILALIIVAGVSFWFGQSSGETDGELRGKAIAEESAAKTAVREAQLAKVELEQAIAEAKRARSEVEELKKSSEPEESAKKTQMDTPPEPKIEASPPAPPEPPKKLPKPKRDVFSDIANRKKQLSLPPVFLVNVNAWEAGKINPKLELLAELFVEDFKQCELSVAGGEFTDARAGMHELKRKNDEGGCTWTLLTTTSTGVGQEWGFFRLEGEKLKFQWKGKPPVRLQFCHLNITVGDKTECCSLNRVDKLPRVEIDVEEPFTVPLKCLTGVLRKDDPLRIELQLDSLESEILVNGEKRKSMKLGETAEIRVKNPDVKSDDGRTHTVAIEIAFLAPPTGGSLAASSVPPRLHGEVCAFPRKYPGNENRRMSLSPDKKFDEVKALGTNAEVSFNGSNKLEREWLGHWAKVDPEERGRAVEYQRLRVDSLSAQNRTNKEKMGEFDKRLKEFPDKDKAEETIKNRGLIFNDARFFVAEEYERV
ncbi:MAG: hypothetical protein NTY19_03125, partial [Planctomycetota bacterium]|nr:hypothetical protein [Planctomycetota bacterium]